MEIDVEKMETRGVQPFQLVMGLRSDNFALTGGYIQEGGKKIFVRSMAKYRSKIFDSCRSRPLLKAPHERLQIQICKDDL